MQLKKLTAALAFTGLALSGSAFATNGMVLEGYGPISLGMGGAATAYDNGTAAMMNNPATLALGGQGSRLDFALGTIGPRVNTNAMGSSDAGQFAMPAFGYTNTSGNLTYGIGMFAQGGMGTDYDPAPAFAEVSVGRVIFPLAYSMGNLTVGGSIDYVFAGMDLVYGGFGIDFKDNTKYTGKIKGNGWAGKIGVTYKASEQFTLGATYQTEGNLSDLKGAGWKMTGFDMPAIAAIGVAFKPNDKMMIAVDVKDVMWDSSMNTPVIYYPGGGDTGPGFRQDWDDQTVFALGLSYKINEQLTGRIGVNIADNPIPDQYVSPLWPATVKNHYTAGFGYAMSKESSLDFAVSYAPEVKVTGTRPANTLMPGDPGNLGLEIRHSQLNWQLMYSMKF